MRGIPIVIPAYQPGNTLVVLVAELVRISEHPIVIVDDGSGPQSAAVFERLPQGPRVQLLHHAVNLGKGAALKTALNHAITTWPQASGVVTADADGQHHPEDILRVAERLAANPDALVMGVREFGTDVPLRSRIGNGLTRLLMRVVVGQRLADTQTGLRGIPSNLIPHLLRLQSAGYEFELDMLIACKHQNCSIVQEPIRTIYEEGNRSSHFRPVLDSMRIYFLLFRFTVLSLLTAVLDNLVFALALNTTGSIGRSQIAARVVAMVFNYLGARALVFHSRQRHAAVLPKYVGLVLVNGLCSYALLRWIHASLGVPAISAKIAAEGLLFIANFAIQRDFIFTRRKAAGGATDWDRYYTSVPPTAKLTRRYTTAVLVDAIRRYVPTQRPSVVEIGGANSCFAERILGEFACERYEVVDTNRYGLDLLEKRGLPAVRVHQQDVREMALGAEADLVFSVGLVEHFDREGTRAAARAHLDAARSGGIVLITFPSPTWLYRASRRVIEAVGMWKFPDERPLDPEEVVAAIGEAAEVVYRKTLWPLVLTQHLIVARKR